MSYWPAFLAPDGTVSPPADRYSDLGATAGGSTVAAGSVLPATAGRIIINPGATTWVKITGTDAKQGDAVVCVFEGLRVTSDGTPAQRRVSAAGPGAAGINTLNDGEIELSLSGSNADNTYMHWFLLKTPI